MRSTRKWIVFTIVAMALVGIVAAALASGTKPPAPPPPPPPAVGADAAQPTNLGGTDGAGQTLFPEGKKVEIVGTLHPVDNQRYQIRSSSTKMAYTILENSLLEQMAKTHRERPTQRFKTVVRMTRYAKQNYVFITQVSLVR